MPVPIDKARLGAVVRLVHAGRTTEQIATELGLTYSQANGTRRIAVHRGLIAPGDPGKRKGCADDLVPATVQAWMAARFNAAEAARQLGCSQSTIKKRLVRAAELGLIPTDTAKRRWTRHLDAKAQEENFGATVRDLVGASASSSATTAGLKSLVERQATALASIEEQLQALAEAVASVAARPVATDALAEPAERGAYHAPQGPTEFLRRQLEVVVAALGPDVVAKEVSGLSSRTIKLGLSGHFGSQVDAVALDRLYVLVRAVDLDLDEDDIGELERLFRRARRDRLDAIVGHQGGQA